MESNESETSINYNDTTIALESMIIDRFQEDDNYSDLDSDEEEKEMSRDKHIVRPKFNEWHGQEVDLHLLGPFDTEFDRKVKSIVRPEMVSLKLDPFYRNDHPDSGDPVHGNVYRIWKNTNIRSTDVIIRESIAVSGNSLTETMSKKEDAIPESLDTDNKPEDIENDEIPGDTNINEENEDLGEIEDDDDDDYQNVVGYNLCDLECSESETENDIREFIESLRLKKKEGINLTGESLWYDESKDTIRNLHENSYSLTSYVPPDNNIFGKGDILKSILTPSELKMLQP